MINRVALLCLVMNIQKLRTDLLALPCSTGCQQIEDWFPSSSSRLERRQVEARARAALRSRAPGGCFELERRALLKHYNPIAPEDENKFSDEHPGPFRSQAQPQSKPLKGAME